MQSDMKQGCGKSWLGAYIGRDIRSGKTPMVVAGLRHTEKNKHRALLQLMCLF